MLPPCNEKEHSFSFIISRHFIVTEIVIEWKSKNKIFLFFTNLFYLRQIEFLRILKEV